MSAGIPFVPLDCNLDEKFEKIEAKYGLTGFAVIVKLFQRIMGVHGYYCEWNENIATVFEYKECGSCGNVCEIVKYAVKTGLFDEKMFKKYGVLTSHGIQVRFLKTVKRRKIFFEKPEYVLLSQDEIISIAGKTDDNTDIPPKKESGSNPNANACTSNANACTPNANACTQNANACTPNANACTQNAFACNSNQNACNSPPNACNSPQNACNSDTSKVSKASKEIKSNPTEIKQAVTRSALAEKYGDSKITEYERRFEKWRKKKGGNVHTEMYSEIAKWLVKDNVPEIDRSKYDAVDRLMQQVLMGYQNSP